MRKTLWLLCFLFFVGLPVTAGPLFAAPAQNYYYDSIRVDIVVNQDSTFDVVEEQTYRLRGSFGFFYRDIELKGLDHISNIQVFDGRGRKISKDAYTISSGGNSKRVQWDFPRRVFDNELKSWIVMYRVHGGLGFYKEWDELYWNAIFADREVFVKQAEVIVHLPEGVDAELAGKRLFVGLPGSTVESRNYQVINRNTVKFSGKEIAPGHFLTTVASWPKGYVAKPLLYRSQLINWIISLAALGLPLFVFARSYLLWKKKGRDPKLEKTVIAHYTPPVDLPPAVVGVLMKQNVAVKDIVSTVIDLAVRGYIRIREGEKRFWKGQEYLFEKLKSERDLKLFEQKIMRGIFRGRKRVSSGDLRNKFYAKIPGIKKSLHAEVNKTKYFTGNIQHIRKKYGRVYKISFFVLLLVFIGSRFLVDFLQKDFVYIVYIVYILILGLSVALSVAIGRIFAHYMPALTAKGLEAKWQWLGFREYLHTAERFRIGVETLETFSKYLPYAMILGVEMQWARRFSYFSYQQQSWYVHASRQYHAGGAVPGFNTLTVGLSSFASSITKTLSSSPGRSSGMGGGGGAGGGGGGGGGGAG